MVRFDMEGGSALCGALKLRDPMNSPGSNHDVFIVDEDSHLRNCLSILVNGLMRMQVSGTFSSPEQAQGPLARIRPDIVLTEYSFSDMNGIQFASWIRSKLPSTKVLMITEEASANVIIEALESGVHGFLIKEQSPMKILDALKDVARGASPLCVRSCTSLVKSFHEKGRKLSNTSTLTRRENEIMQYLVKGHASKEIASELCISIPTVNTHLTRIYEKLEVHSRSAAVARYLNL